MPSPTTGGDSTSVAFSGNDWIDALLYGTKWDTGAAGDGVSLTYSFPSGDASFAFRYGSGEPSGWSPLDATQSAAFVSALESWANVANISFTQVDDGESLVGDIRAAFSTVVSFDGGTLAWAYLPGNTPEAGDVWLSPSEASNLNPAPGTEGYSTLVHEIGHALGLKHPFEGPISLPAEQDNFYNTVMTYDWSSGIEPITPMPLDILAIQYLYGANMSTGAGDDTYTLSDNGLAWTIWDSGGTDLLDASSAVNAVSIDLQEGQYSTAGSQSVVAVAYNTVIENATGGTGSDLVIANNAANRVSAAAGDDTIVGGAGADTLSGNEQNDVLYGNQGDDLIYGGKNADQIHGGQGNDTIDGRQGHDELHGRVGEDAIVGGPGMDTIYGNEGSDLIYGEENDDLIYGGQQADWIDGGDGNDWIAGKRGHDALFGGPGADTVYGDDGNDVLVGGEGDDTLVGGAGADTFYVDAGDLIQDLEPDDTVLDWSLV